MDKIFEVHERANEMMFEYLWPEFQAEHQFEGQYGLDFRFNYDIFTYVGDYKFNSQPMNQYDDNKGLLLEPTKLDKFKEHKDTIGLYIRFCIDGVAIMNVNKFDPEKYKHTWNESWVEKTQMDKSNRQKEVGWHIPSTDPIWQIQKYTPSQVRYHSKVLKWKEDTINQIQRSNAMDVFNKFF